MTTWEYSVAVYAVNKISFEDWLNEKGALGWELVSIYVSPNETLSRCVFKRPVTPSAPSHAI